MEAGVLNPISVFNSDAGEAVPAGTQRHAWLCQPPPPRPSDTLGRGDHPKNPNPPVLIHPKKPPRAAPAFTRHREELSAQPPSPPASRFPTLGKKKKQVVF